MVGAAVDSDGFIVVQILFEAEGGIIMSISFAIVCTSDSSPSPSIENDISGNGGTSFFSMIIVVVLNAVVADVTVVVVVVGVVVAAVGIAVVTGATSSTVSETCS